MQYTKAIIIAILIITNIKVQAQEFIVPNAKTFEHKNHQTRQSIELPFYDDFAYTNASPDEALWQNQGVYVSSTFTDNAPTWGVAVFDAVNEKGVFPETANYEERYISDILTSKPINLNYPNDKTIFLSFFYEPGGFGDLPEKTDSLCLEFYDVENETWQTVWVAEGSADKTFKYVIIPIDQPEYLKDGFKFRFKNHITLGSEVYPDLAINADHWLVDMVYLNKGRSATDNSFNDLAITAPLTSLLTPYSAMPYKQFVANPQKYIAPEVASAYQNNDGKIRTIDSLKLSVAEFPNGANSQTVNGGSYNIPPKAGQAVKIKTGFNFNDKQKDSLKLKLTLKLVTDDSDPKPNNTITRIHNLSNFYAYDDGTAEAGYGLYGNGTKYGRIALKFHTDNPVQITAVKMYFNQTYNNENQDYLFLNIWKQAKNGLPETEPLFSQEGIRPEYGDTLNKFHTYKLDSLITVQDTFFIGWTQTQPKMLNIGFDLNTTANQFLYYNISGAWQPSKIKGAIMMRPVVKNLDGKKAKKRTSQKISVKPNPANENIIITIPNKTNSDVIQYQILNFSGKVVATGKTAQNFINVSELPNGIYILKAYIKQHNSYTSKFMIMH